MIARSTYQVIQADLNHLMEESVLNSKGVKNKSEKEIYRKAVRACKSVISNYNPDKTTKDEGGW